MVGEYVHIDLDLDGTSEPSPGDIRPWVLGHTGNGASYAFKVSQFVPNAGVNRDEDGIPFNHLPMSSFHTGVTNFVLADSSVHTVSDSVNVNIYQSLSTSKGGEPVSIGDL